MEPTKILEAVEIGQSASISKTVSESDAYLFAGITGDLHPIHVNDEFAKSTEFGRRIVHGALSMGFLSAAATRLAETIGSTGPVLSRYDVRFRRPVLFGDTITATVRVVEKRPDSGELILEAEIANQRGEVVTRGGATMKLRPGIIHGKETQA